MCDWPCACSRPAPLSPKTRLKKRAIVRTHTPVESHSSPPTLNNSLSQIRPAVCVPGVLKEEHILGKIAPHPQCRHRQAKYQRHDRREREDAATDHVVIIPADWDYLFPRASPTIAPSGLSHMTPPTQKMGVRGSCRKNALGGSLALPLSAYAIVLIAPRRFLARSGGSGPIVIGLRNLNGAGQGRRR